jgi:hypothetical protein
MYLPVPMLQYIPSVNKHGVPTSSGSGTAKVTFRGLTCLLLYL